MRDRGKNGLDHEHMQRKINQNSEFLSKYQVGSMTSVTFSDVLEIAARLCVAEQT